MTFIDMTGWKMWEHGFPVSTLIVKKRAEKNNINIKMLMGDD